MKFDDILLEIGEFGPYQKRIFYLMALPVIVAGAQVFSVLFTYDIPAYRCTLPGFPGDSYSIQGEAHARVINQTIPPAGDDDVGEYSGCLLYALSNDSNINGTTAPFQERNKTDTQECQRRVYDESDHLDTVITEFDLVCGGEIMRSHSNTLAFFGSFVGSIFMGVFADVFGRKKAILLALLLQFISGLVTVFAQTFYVILGVRIFSGIATHALFAIPTTTGIELVGPNKRSFTGIVTEVYWSVGVLLMLPVAYLSRQWRYTQLVIVIATFPIFALWWLIPESPRWLLDKRRYAEVEVILEKICKSNRCKLPAGAITADSNDEGPQMSVWGLFQHKVLIIRFLIIIINWFAVNLLYYGLSLNTLNLEGSPYVNYLFGGAVEMLAYIFCLVFVNRVGRKKFHCVGMCIGGLACLAIIPTILLDGDEWIKNLLAQIGKFCSSCSYAILYIMSAELFPTVLRNSAIGVCSIFEALSGMISPYIVDLSILVGGHLGMGLPMAVFGGISLLAGGLSLLLPETLHRKLPETIQDSINFGKDEIPVDESKTDKGARYEPAWSHDTDTVL